MLDALDILTDLENVIPFFQPIFNAEEHRIVGYEILGRYRSGNEEVSLGPFFRDETIPEEYRVEVDNTVLLKALGIAAETNDPDLLWFINRQTDLLVFDDGEPFLQLILSFADKGLSPDRIVVELSDDKKENRNSQIGHLLNYYKSFGVKIAIDNVGSDSKLLDRLGELAPEILKIDLSAMRSIHVGSAYLDVLHSLAILARKIGATLLFENIETSYQLQFAWKNGGRFYQGYYLQKPDGQLKDKNILKEKLKSEIHGFILSEKKILHSLFDLRMELNAQLIDLLSRHKKLTAKNELLLALAKSLDEVAFRMYICDEDGFQKSPNVFKKNELWTIQPEYEGKNWSWRPYFLENIIRMRTGKRGILSDRYSDIETGELIRTFSLPLSESEFLFIDLVSAYLYEKEGLF